MNGVFNYEITTFRIQKSFGAQNNPQRSMTDKSGIYRRTRSEDAGFHSIFNAERKNASATEK